MFKENKNYLFHRKIIAVHSQDRDINKWPKSNEFEVTLPIQYNKVNSIQLLSLQLPKNYNIFSNYNENTKIKFDNDTIQINDGTYTPKQMCAMLENKLSSINVKYNDVDMKFYFYSDNPFTISAGENITYNGLCVTNNVYNYTFNWGLPFYLGFEKKTYTSTTGTAYLIFDSDGTTSSIDSNKHVIISSVPAPVYGEEDIYLEIDKYNYIDEIQPYSINTNNNITDVSYLSCVSLASLRGERSSNYKHITENNLKQKGIKCLNKSSNDYNGIYNSSFAKIPISVESGRTVIHDSAFLNNIFYSEPPIDKLSKLKFKFRYHDGRLVDFYNHPVSVTIGLGMFRDEYDKGNTIRFPEAYS
tara:strand:+ start:3942 stop:5015 length:1074 start_codon:yes stop_codon:yes gene_type:complete